MSKFEKAIIPLIDDCIRPIDLSSSAGFIDSFTIDPDNPSGNIELFLVYDDRKRGAEVTSRMQRFEKSRNVKRTYVKYVNNTPYYIYSFWIKPEVKKLYSGVMALSTIQKAQILQFWGPFDNMVDSLLNNLALVLDVQHVMPLSDYRESPFEKAGITITKIRDSLEMRLPLIFLYLYRMILQIGKIVKS